MRALRLSCLDLDLSFPPLSRTSCLEVSTVYATAQLTKGGRLAIQSKGDFLLSDLCIFIFVRTVHILIRFLLPRRGWYWLIDYFIEHSGKSLGTDYAAITTLIYWGAAMYLPAPSGPYYLLGWGASSGLASSALNVCVFVPGFLSRRRWYGAGLMAGHFGESCDEIMSLALPNMVSTIPIGYDTLHIDIIILETAHTKYNMFSLVHHLPHA